MNWFLLFKDNYLIVAVIVFVISIFTLFFVKEKNKVDVKFVIPEASEWIIFDIENMKVINHSDNFFQIIGNIDSNDFIKSFQENHKEIYEEILNSIKTKNEFSLFIPKLSIHLSGYQENNLIHMYSWSCKDIFDFLPIPLKVNKPDCSFENAAYKTFNDSCEISLPIPGKFFVFQNMIFKKEIFGNANENFIYFFPFLSIEERDKLFRKNYPKLPIPFIVCKKDGTIKFITDSLKQMFDLSENINRIHDFFNEIRGKFIPDKTSFHSIKNEIINKFKKIDKEFSEVLTTMNNRFIFARYVPYGEEIWIFYEDLSEIFKIQEEFTNDFQQSILNKVNDIIVLFDDNNNLIYSNFPFDKKDNYVSIKGFLTNMGNIKEFSFKNKKCIMSDFDIVNKLHKLEFEVEDSIVKVERLFEQLAEKYNSTIQEYGKYVKFLLFGLQNNIKAIEYSLVREVDSQRINIHGIFQEVFKKVSSIFPIKNLQININHDDFVVVNENFIKNCFESLLFVSFKYQFEQKTIEVHKENNFIKISLNNLPNKNAENMFEYLTMLNNIHMKCFIDVHESHMSIGFLINKN